MSKMEMDLIKMMLTASDVYFWAVKKGKLQDSAIIERIMQLGGLKCEYCTSTFNCPFDFIQHICLQEVQYYTSFKNFVCVPCNRTFATKQSLIRHMKANENEENHKRDAGVKKARVEYACQYCDKRFVRKQPFCIHLEKCKENFNKYCDKVTEQQRNDQQHVTVQTGEIPVEDYMDFDLAQLLQEDFTVEDVDRAEAAKIVYTCDVSMHCYIFKICL